MSGTPLLSVFIPAFNAAKHVREALESVLDNGFADFEVVVVDDGSADDTARIVESIRHPALRLIRHPENLGIGATRYRSVSLLRGRYVALLDADDIAVHGRFETQVSRLEQPGGPDILGSAVECFGDDEGIHFSPLSDAEIRASLLFNASLINPSVCLKVAPLREGNIQYRADAGPACDYALWVDAMRAGLRFENLSAVLTRYRRHGEAMTTKLPFREFGVQNIVVRRRVVDAYFPTLAGEEREALVDALSYRLGGGHRWINAVYAMSHAAMLAKDVLRIDSRLMIRLFEEHLLRTIQHAVELGGIDNETLEMMTETNQYFEQWRAADDGELDARIMALFG